MNDPVPSKHNPFAMTASHGGGLVSIEMQRAIAEVQASMIVARSMPRNQPRSVDRILQECTNPELAEESSYAYNRGGTEIEAPSIRLAETMARHWGNLQCGVRELSRRDGYSECQAYAQDLETGYKEERTFQIKHWRDTKKGGYEITEERDIYELVANNGARRKRACILALIPMDVQAMAMRECAKTLAADGGEITADRIQAMLSRFAEFKVTKEMIERRVGRSIESVPPVVFRQLQRIFNSMRDHMSSPEDWFEVTAPAADPATPASDNTAKGKLRKAGKKAAERAKEEGGAAPARSSAPTTASVLKDIISLAAAAEAIPDVAVATLKLDDAKDLARALTGDDLKKAQEAIADAEGKLDARKPKA